MLQYHVEIFSFECRCESDDGFTNDEISSVCVSFMQAQYAIQNNGTFDKRDDFTFIIQPFLQDVRDPPRNVCCTFSSSTIVFVSILARWFGDVEFLCT